LADAPFVTAFVNGPGTIESSRPQTGHGAQMSLEAICRRASVTDAWEEKGQV